MVRFILLSCFLLLSEFSYSQIINKITYRGFEDCYELSNNHVRLIVAVSSGGRVLSFEKNDHNVIYENQNLNGVSYEDFLKNNFDPDGGRFDVGPEEITKDLHQLTWMGEWETLNFVDNMLTIISPVDSVLGLQTIRSFELNPKCSHVTIKQTIINISNTNLAYSYWGRTLVKIGGKLILPKNNNSEFPLGWGKYQWNPSAFITKDLSDNSFKSKGKYLIFEPQFESKYGTDATNGWMAYHLSPSIFIKKWKVDEIDDFRTEYNLKNIVYTNMKFLEMEPVSPLIELSPGQTFSFVEYWWLFDEKEISSNSKKIGKFADQLAPP